MRANEASQIGSRETYILRNVTPFSGGQGVELSQRPAVAHGTAPAFTPCSELSVHG
jgi:hypothetical protein